MKCLCIPDIHGSYHWKKAKKLIDDYDKIVFLGDYVDEWKNKQPQQKNNLIAIIKFKQKYPEKVDLLIGNHDTSYWLDERCSGYQPEQAFDYYELFHTARKHFDVVAIYDNWIFSHAGVSKEWMKCCGIKTPQEINRLFRERPNFFKFVGPESSGRNDEESPLWIRENLVRCSIPNVTQIIGHTELKNGPFKINNNFINCSFIYLDTENHNYFLEMDTSKKNKLTIIDSSNMERTKIKELDYDHKKRSTTKIY